MQGTSSTAVIVNEQSQPERKHKVNNGLVFLRVKAKSLADEARIIKREESRAKKNKQPELKQGLRDHRVTVVRAEARATNLARAFITGVPYKTVEQFSREGLPYARIVSMVKKYGGWDLARQTDGELYRKLGDWKKA